MYKDSTIVIHKFPMSFYNLYPHLLNVQVHSAMKYYVQHHFHGQRHNEKPLIDNLLSMIGKVSTDVISDVAATTGRVLAALDEKFSCYTDGYAHIRRPDIKVVYIPVDDTSFALILSSSDLLEKQKYYTALGEALMEPIRPPNGRYQIPEAIVKGELPLESFDMMLKWIIDGVRTGTIPPDKEATYAEALLYLGEQLPKMAEEMVTFRQYRWSYVFDDDHTFTLIFESSID
jgi:hypothetical protein